MDACFVCLLFFSTWCPVLKMIVRLFQIKQVKALKKVLQELINYKEEKCRKRDKFKRVLDNLRMPQLQEISQQLPACVIAMRDSQFCIMFSRLFCSEQVIGIEKLFRETVHK